MGLPAPKLQNLTDWLNVSDTNEHAGSNEVWEIGVPMKNSLPWSIVLSYLLSASEEKFPLFLEKLTGNDKEIKSKKELNLGKVNADTVKKELKSLNPFKNRHAFFNQAKEVIKVFRIFDLRLKRYAKSLKPKPDEWNDDFKLNAASLLLERTIQVYFPEETGHEKLISYPKTPKNFESEIVLFQYENRKHGKRTENINVFHFAMALDYAHPLQLAALVHIFRKTKLQNQTIHNVKDLMSRAENHGKDFLPLILQNEHFEVIPEIYRSPYIAVKLSEAGFETDPTSTSSEEPSPFCYAALLNSDVNCIRILYDYASNCRFLFDRSVRRADDIILSTLTRIKKVMKKDIILLQTRDSQKNSHKRASDILKQYISFIEYQFETALDLTALSKKRELETASDVSDLSKKRDEFQYRKKVIEIILHHYSDRFSNASLQTMNLPNLLLDYFDFSIYYQNADNFAYALFFDNFYKLKLCIDIKQENLFLDIEWNMFLALMSDKYFSHFNSEKVFRSEYENDEENIVNNNILQFIPLIHRSVAQSKIKEFLLKLKDVSDSEELKKSLNIKEFKDNPKAIPQVTDTLMLSRLMTHIDAALEISAVDDGIKAVLAIERALQIIGESIKSPASSNSSASYLLRSLLPHNFQKTLVYIRNNILSHCRDYLVHGKLLVEGDLKFFDNMREELKEIKTLFEIVNFTQFLRLEEALMFNFIRNFENYLTEEIKNIFYTKYEERINERIEKYEEKHNQCMKLLWDTSCELQNNIPQLFNNIQNDIQQKQHKNKIFGWLKSIASLISFIIKHKWNDDLNKFLGEIEKFIEDNIKRSLDDNMKNDLLDFFSIFNKQISHESSRKNESLVTFFPHISSFPDKLKINPFSEKEIDCIKSATENAYKEAEKAGSTLKDMFKDISHLTKEKLDECLDKVLIPTDKIGKIRMAFESRDSKLALKYFAKKYASENVIEEVAEYIRGKSDATSSKDSGISSCGISLLSRITYQRNLTSKLYPSAEKQESTLETLEQLLMKKVRLLINRIEAMKSILIDEDDDIQKTWAWGKSDAIKHHMKFLMRQRYVREETVRASLDMAFFDCVNILRRPSLKELYEKSTDLFAGIDLRNVLSHCTNIETFGGVLDKDDFPSSMIENMLKLVDDLEAIESMLDLFSETGDLTEEGFKNWIETNENQKYAKQIKSIIDCKRWGKYLFLFPFVKI